MCWKTFSNVVGRTMQDETGVTLCVRLEPSPFLYGKFSRVIITSGTFEGQQTVGPCKFAHNISKPWSAPPDGTAAPAVRRHRRPTTEIATTSRRETVWRSPWAGLPVCSGADEMLIPKPKEIILGSAGGQQQEDRTSSSKTSRTIGRTCSGLFFMVRFLVGRY